jgi:hypothetical protein
MNDFLEAIGVPFVSQGWERVAFLRGLVAVTGMKEK